MDEKKSVTQPGYIDSEARIREKPGLNYINSEIKAIEDFIIYSKAVNHDVFDENVPRDLLKILKGMRTPILMDPSLEEELKKKLLYSMGLLEGYLVYIEKMAKRRKGGWRTQNLKTL